MRTLRVLLGLPIVVLLFAACGSGGRVSPSSAAPTSSATDGSAALTTSHGLVAIANGAVTVYASDAATAAIETLAAHTHFGSPTTMLVLGADSDGSWLRVSLPTRPNGSFGYVRRSDVTVASFDHRVDVDLAARRLRVADANGDVVIDTPVAVGSAQNPTPTGAFFVTDVIDTRNSGGSAYGPYALGLSAHSNTLTEFVGGDGEIGIHGTNEPGSIGNAVSHGCVRVPNDIAVQLAQMMTLGTPVTIH